MAIIHARTAYTKRDGERGGGWYTDTWAKHAAKGLGVAAPDRRGSLPGHTPFFLAPSAPY